MRTEARGQFFRLTALGLSAALVALALGCGGGKGDVAGKVTYKNKPVVYGTVTFVGGDALPVAAQISPDGSYSVSGVGPGEAKILVDSSKPIAEGASGRGTGGAGRGGRSGARDMPDSPEGKQMGSDRVKDTPDTVAPEVAAKWFPIPDKYLDPTRTTLTFTVKSGKNTHDIKLD